MASSATLSSWANYPVSRRVLRRHRSRNCNRSAPSYLPLYPLYPLYPPSSVFLLHAPPSSPLPPPPSPFLPPAYPSPLISPPNPPPSIRSACTLQIRCSHPSPCVQKIAVSEAERARLDVRGEALRKTAARLEELAVDASMALIAADSELMQIDRDYTKLHIEVC